MSKQKTTKAKTSRSLPVFIADSSSTTGGGLSGVTHSSSGLVLEYRRQNQSTWTSVTPVSKTLGTYVSGGIVADGSLAGAYEVDFPDAAFASAAGVEWVALRIRGVTNMLPVLIEIELDAVDYQDATAFGLSRIDATIGSRATQTSVDAIPTAVWNSLTTATYTNQSFGDRILISNNNTREISVTGSGHAAAVLHDAEPNSIPEDAFVSGAVSARALAADAATEIATAVAATQALSRLDSMIESDGAGQFRFDTIALEMAPAGGGGGNQTINVYPVSASTPERVQGTTLTFYRNESRSVSVVTDFTLTSLTLQFTVEDQDGVDVYTLANGSITRSSQTFTVAVTTAVTGNLGQYRWSMRDISGGGSSVIAMGVLTVQEAASNV